MMLEVGKVYRHSDRDVHTQWKIVNAWGENMFEGKAVDHDRNTPHGTSVMFDKSGYPIGAEGKYVYKPNGWHLLPLDSYDYVCLCKDGSFYKQWEAIDKNTRRDVNPTTAMYLVRKNNDVKTSIIYDYYKFMSFLDELFW